MPFRIGLDARSLSTPFMRGMGEYVTALMRCISPSRDVRWSLYGNRPDLPFHRPPGEQIERVVLRDTPGNRFKTWEQAVLPAQAARHRTDVLHCTATTLPLWQPVPTVVTIHDTIPWHSDEDMKPGFYRDWLLPRAYARCEAIITISQHSRNDILRLWPALAGKVRVIHHGVNPEFLACAPAPVADTLRDCGVARPYLLYLGGVTPRKRLLWTLELFHAIGRTDVDLVVCGVAADAHAAYRDRLDPALRRRVIFMPFVAPGDMPLLYQNAIAVLYPTLYEGFGFPAIHAQAVGTPIVLSAVSSLLELAGPGSIALPPDAEAAWVEACRTLIGQRIGSPAPDPAARTWARRFDWSVSARAHWEVYQQAARGPARKPDSQPN
jgi:alpha-1,3-rhamnosyl/mannosyltransferase